MAIKAATFRLDEQMLAALQAIKERDGVPINEQVKRALQAWLDKRGSLPKAKKS